MNKKGEKNNFSHSSIFLKSRRGQGLSVNAIIMIVLGVVVLAVLALGFTMGWKNIAPWIGAGNNVDNIVTACSVAGNTQSKYDFCTVKRELKTEDGTFKDVNCFALANIKSFSKYGVGKASSITCDQLLSDKTTESEAKDKTKEPCKSNLGKVVQYVKDKALMSVTCPN